MTYVDRPDTKELWWDLYHYPLSDCFFDSLQFTEERLVSLLEPTVSDKTRKEVDKLRYALAADYIEENWDRLLSICVTAAGVNPEPLLRRLLERLRAEWADCLNGGAK